MRRLTVVLSLLALALLVPTTAQAKKIHKAPRLHYDAPIKEITLTLSARRHYRYRTNYGSQNYNHAYWQHYQQSQVRPRHTKVRTAHYRTRHVRHSRSAHGVDRSRNLVNVVSHKTGAYDAVGAAHAPKFQAYIDDLETNYGATIYTLGGIRRGRCGLGSQHPCGMALDVCQLRWGTVDKRCNLPSRIALAAIALKHGLFEGGLWCSNDYGHAQVKFSAEACGKNLFVAVTKFKDSLVAALDEAVDPEAKVYDYRQVVAQASIPEVTKPDVKPSRSYHARRHVSHRRYARRHYHRRTMVAAYQYQYPTYTYAAHQ